MEFLKGIAGKIVGGVVALLVIIAAVSWFTMAPADRQQIAAFLAHHWAFDRGLWAIHPSKLTIEVARRSRKHLGDIHGKVIVRPSSIKGIAALGREYLEWRWAQFQRRGR